MVSIGENRSSSNIADSLWLAYVRRIVFRIITVFPHLGLYPFSVLGKHIHHSAIGRIRDRDALVCFRSLTLWPAKFSSEPCSDCNVVVSRPCVVHAVHDNE